MYLCYTYGEHPTNYETKPVIGKTVPLKDCISIYWIAHCSLYWISIWKCYTTGWTYQFCLEVSVKISWYALVQLLFVFFFSSSLILITTTMHFSPVNKRYKPSLEGLLKDCSALVIQSLKEYSQSWVTYLTKRIFFSFFFYSDFQTLKDLNGAVCCRYPDRDSDAEWGTNE